MPRPELAQDDEQGDQVVAASPPVDDRRERLPGRTHVECLEIGGRMRPEQRQHALDAREHARQPAERQAGGDRRHHLAVAGIVVSPDELDGIGRRIGHVVAVVQPIELAAKAREVVGAQSQEGRHQKDVSGTPAAHCGQVVDV